MHMLKTYCIKFSKNEYKMKEIHTAFHLFSGLLCLYANEHSNIRDRHAGEAQLGSEE